jgi:FMN phosphatase YigB (HAD superfamily)
MTADTVFADARRLLESGGIGLLSFDVFDSLVWRPVATPLHLFRILGRELVARGWVPEHVAEDDVLGARRIAEERARSAALVAHGSDEATLEEIWAEMPSSWRARPIADYAALEIDVEAAHLVTIEESCALLTDADRLGVPVALISDTYLSADQLGGLLATVGVPMGCVGTVTTSSGARRNKVNGLIAHVIGLHDVDPSTVLHIGDNELADGVAAVRAGARSIRLDDRGLDDRPSPMAIALGELSAGTGSDGGGSAIPRLLRLRDGADASGSDRRRPAHAAAYDFGCEVGGPLLTGFADWIVASAAALGVPRIHYLLREGGFIADVVAASCPDAPEARLVHASRWVTMRASVVTGSAEEILRATARRARFAPEHVIDAFDLEPGLVHSVIGRSELDDRARLDAIEALAAHDDTREAIIASSAMLRRRLVELYSHELRPDDGRLVLCDIGWGGTIQEGLTDLLRHEGWEIDVIGLYLMLSTPGRRRVQRGARMYGFLPDEGDGADDASAVMRAPEIAEQLCTPEIGTFVDVGPDGAVLAADVGGAVASRRRARQGVIDYADLRRRSPSTPPDPARKLLAGFAGTLQRPGRRLAEELGAWTHDDVGGTDHEALVHADAAELLGYANAAELDLIGGRDLYWIAGTAAVLQPGLAAHLDAIHHGVAGDDLCPPSELGEARIAVFPPGSLDATHQIERTPRRNTLGWSMLRLTATTGEIRSIRCDVGDRAALVELGALTVGVDSETVRIERADDPRLVFVGGHALTEHLFVVDADGYIAVAGADLPDADGRAIDVQVAFRGLPLTPRARRRLAPNQRERIDLLVRRGRRRFGRRR